MRLPSSLLVLLLMVASCSDPPHFVAIDGAAEDALLAIDAAHDAAIDASDPIDASDGLVRLDVTSSGTGGGTIVSSPDGIACAPTCSAMLPVGTFVSLVASPDVGSVFGAWSGPCSGAVTTCAFTLTEDTAVAGSFQPSMHDITLVIAGNGTGSIATTAAGLTCPGACSTSLAYGTQLTLTAATQGTSQFLGWSGTGCSGTSPCSLTVTGDVTITASFGLDHTVVVTRVGNGTGSVASSPAGIACGADCDQAFAAGTMVTLTATPASSSTFDGWSGGGCSGTSTCVVTVSSAIGVAASFVLKRHALTAVLAGTGGGVIASTPSGISCPTDCSESIDDGQMVTLTVTPNGQSLFTGWTGACSGTGACTVTMDQARTVTATFTLKQYALTTTVAGTGGGTITSTPAGISCPGDCMEPFDHGQVVSVSAMPNAQSLFAGWSGACTGTGACTVTMDQLRSVGATFTPKPYALTATLAGNGGGTITSTPAGISCPADCTEMFDHGQVVTLSATPNAQSLFTGWTGACSGAGACSVTVDQARSITATFTLKQYTLIAMIGGNGGGTVTSAPTGIVCPSDCSELIDHGSVVSLSATPNAQSVFSGWSGACSGSGACTVTMDQARNVTATFTLKSYLLTTTLAGNGGGTVASAPNGISCPGDCMQAYDHGQVVTLSATPNAQSLFGGWTGACTGTGACSVTMDQTRNVTATFTLKKHLLTTTLAGNSDGTVTSSPGGVSCPADCTEMFDHGQMVTLTATANAQSTLTGWSGACSGTGACTVTMDQARSATATFALKQFSLSVSKTGNGTGKVTGTGIDCGADCSENVVIGTQVTLVAAPDRGTLFVGWSGPCTGTGSCTITINAITTVTATFERTIVFEGEYGVAGANTISIGTTVNRACFLSGIAGNFLENSGTAYVYTSGTTWMLTASVDVHAYAQCFTYSSASNLMVEDERTVSNGSTMLLGSTSNRVCFITQMQGQFTGGFVTVYAQSGVYYLLASGSGRAGKARCLTWPAATPLVVAAGGGTWMQGPAGGPHPAPVDLGPVGDRFCGFTTTQGRFAGLGELVYVRPGVNWFVGGTSGQTSVAASARCLAVP